MRNLLFFLIFFSLAEAYGQNTLQVLTKTIRKSTAWKPGYELEISGEKADIQVESASSNNSISLQAELSAKHPALDTAKTDLEAWKLVVNTVGKKIYVRAYIGVASGKRLPTSNLRAKLTVYIPAGCPVNLSNKYGKARLEKLTGPIALRGEFCQFSLVNLQGQIRLESQYGHVEGHQLSGNVALNTKRAGVSLSGLQGDCTIRSEYGAVSVDATASSGNLNVVASKSDVTVAAAGALQHSFQLRAQHGSIQAPRRFQTTQAGDLHQASWQTGDGRKRISVETNFGKIIVW
jgi:Putative adhesin